MEPVSLSVGSIRIDGNTQVRVEESPDTIQRYADALAANKQLPPIHVFFDGTAYWIGDGHHRLAACKKRGLDSISCIVHEGDRTAALKFACQANQEHGLPLTNADKRNIVLTYFKIPGNENKTNNAIAKELGVSVPFVKNIRDNAGVKASPSAHVGVGAKKKLNGLNNPVKEGGKNLNRLNKSAPKEPGKIITIELPDNDPKECVIRLIRDFKLEHLDSCFEYYRSLR